MLVALSIFMLVFWLMLLANCANLSSILSSHFCMDLLNNFSVRVGLVLALP